MPQDVQGLWGILGQPQAVSLLQQAFVQNRLHHAYLFEGPEGIGKATCAKALFATLNCENPPQPAKACGVCSPCRKTIAGTHPDLIFVDMTLAGLTEEIGRIIQRVSQSAHEGKASMVVFDPADQFSAPTAFFAANRLLKTLEEPIPNTYFVFISKNAQTLLPTLRSRMQRIRFVPLSNEIIKQAVKKRIADSPSLSEESLDLMIELAQGSLGDALQAIVQKDIWQARILLAQELLSVSTRGHAVEIVQICSKAELADRDEVQILLRFLILFLHKKLQTRADTSAALVQKIRIIQETSMAIRRFISPPLALERMLRTLYKGA